MLLLAAIPGSECGLAGRRGRDAPLRAISRHFAARCRLWHHSQAVPPQSPHQPYSPPARSGGQSSPHKVRCFGARGSLSQRRGSLHPPSWPTEASRSGSQRNCGSERPQTSRRRACRRPGSFSMQLLLVAARRWPLWLDNRHWRRAHPFSRPHISPFATMPPRFECMTCWPPSVSAEPLQRASWSRLKFLSSRSTPRARDRW